MSNVVKITSNNNDIGELYLTNHGYGNVRRAGRKTDYWFCDSVGEKLDDIEIIL